MLTLMKISADESEVLAFADRIFADNDDLFKLLPK
jgi:hypothetical protein